VNIEDIDDGAQPEDVNPGTPAKPRRGELRIYLGAAPGVGKTYAMLGEGHRRAERGTDVVVGYVETYGRPKTEGMLDGLEVIPRCTLYYRGTEFTEMDLDAVLARRPHVVLVDELAHSNVPGCRNTKRWQDIDELLDAGIKVLSTVNIQHLESLNDVVQRITGTTQRETVPDEVVRRAEQIELVDITPEALRRRLAHGNIYTARKIDAALANYFRPGNLTALRELALLWVADQVEVALQRYRAEHEITDTWETRERVVVAITGGPETETLIRRARRIAAKAGGELLVVHVLRSDGLIGVPANALGTYRRLAEDLGATFHTVVGDDVPTALLDFARGVNATQLVFGTSRRSRLARLFEEGIGAITVQESGPIDVHMVTHEAAATQRRLRWARNRLSRSRIVAGWMLAPLLATLVTFAGVLLRGHIFQATDAVAFVLVTVVVAIVGGLGPALLAAALSGALYDIFFTHPYYRFTIDEPQNVVALVVMVTVAVLVSLVVDRASRRAEQAARARTEAALLASYARTVLTHPHPLAHLLEKVRENFGLSSVALLERHQGNWQRVASVGPSPCQEPNDADVDVPVTPDVHLALRGRALPAADRRALEAAAGQALLALRQQRMATQAAQAQRRAETTALRTALLSAVGHDLRTPLTSIKAAIGCLRDPELELSTEDTTELLATIEEVTDRLTGLVANLLDSSRLATGAVQPQLKPIGYDEVVAKALSSVNDARSVEVDVDELLPPVLADAGLLERVVANLVDNALRHGRLAPKTGPAKQHDEPVVAVRASAYGGHIELRVVDHGPGLPQGTSESVFTPFQRLGDRDTTNGVGLGLSVAKGFTEAMGGTIRAEETPGGGLTVVISLPMHKPADNQIGKLAEDRR
jgi:two-component system, OmpR family, sensor histidine kinase KdpD